MSTQPKFIIVAGASAGGLNALCELVAQLPADIDAAIFIVLHLSRRGIGEYLSHRLQQNTSMPCHTVDGETATERGHIYVAQPNLHLIVKNGYCRIGDGVKENRWRPSIDVLFRSAAAAYGERVIGVVLTGMLDDGTSGMIAIKRSGGMCMVQDPNEAEYPEMPLSVLNNVEVDHSLPLAEMGAVITGYIKNTALKGTTVPQDVLLEAELSEKVITSIEGVQNLGRQSLYACPDCGGGLWEIKEGKNTRYRCHIGHAYSQADMMKKQQEKVESTLWVALRMMEERRNMLNRLGNEESKRGIGKISADYFQRSAELEKHIDILKQILFETKLV